MCREPGGSDPAGAPNPSRVSVTFVAQGKYQRRKRKGLEPLRSLPFHPSAFQKGLTRCEQIYERRRISKPPGGVRISEWVQTNQPDWALMDTTGKRAGASTNWTASGEDLGPAPQGRTVLSIPVQTLEGERQDAVGVLMDPTLAEARPGQDRNPSIRTVVGEAGPLERRA